LLSIAFLSAFFWVIFGEYLRAFNAFTAVLIIACPCALALSSPFALGTALRILGKYGFYLKNTDIIEQAATIEDIIFDKTGTLTETEKAIVHCKIIDKENFSLQTQKEIWTITKMSAHTLSKNIENFLKSAIQKQEEENEILLECDKDLNIIQFEEIKGKGIQAKIGDNCYKIGSKKWLNYQENEELTDFSGSLVFVSLNEKIIAYFQINPYYRQEIPELLKKLQKKYNLHLLSGDNENEKKYLKQYFLNEENMHFEQSPHDKQNFIKNLQKKHQKVMMLGDGLNDAGALQEANVGLAVTENTSYFTPASDGIVEGKSLIKLANFLFFAKKSKQVIYLSFIISLIYNLIGISFAVSGTLSPLIAAVLMPISSLTVIAFTTISVKSYEKYLKKF
jgi:Cu+-exporting ATPase